MWAAVMLLLASWFMFWGSFITYFDSIRVFWGEYPPAVSVLIILLPIFYVFFGASATYFYVRWMLYFKLPHWSLGRLRYDMKQLSNIYDILSVVIKIVSVSIVVTSDQFGPRVGCNGN